MSEKRRKANRRARSRKGCALAVFFHPDYTVGPGIAPDLLTFTAVLSARDRQRSARGLTRLRMHTAGGESHPALKTFVSTGEPARQFYRAASGDS
ncbi:hypothetical protein Xcc3_36080 [Xanthomonas campestris pv. campestris]|uniref:Secreted protein n=1 Tax=Xanthomonas campestris pv. campestris (strain B100) TaxID=509169 RepID=B0RVD5_XANCB|nr:hypothetical protein Xcc3_36080 [Xanthomonas campestris pv. campestris]CAP53026.1 putative secreted protein [Xanthomonas campestris pv. campestris]